VRQDEELDEHRPGFFSSSEGSEQAFFPHRVLAALFFHWSTLLSPVVAERLNYGRVAAVAVF